MRLIINNEEKKKIIILSLLRFGDLILMTGAFKSIKQKYPHSEITVIINEGFERVTKIVPFVDHFLYFPRETLQKAMTSTRESLFAGFDVIEKFHHQLTEVKYDIAYNFTHNKTSSFLMSFIHAHEKVGLNFNDQQHVLNSSWTNYLNETPVLPSNKILHYADIYQCMVASDSKNKMQVLNTKVQPEDLFELIDHQNYIIVQPLSSDNKKNIPTDKVIEFTNAFLSINSTSAIYLLGSDKELPKLNKMIQQINSNRDRIKAISCTFEQMTELLSQSQLVVSVDTVTKHIASALNKKILEISLGSSYIQKTGAYNKGSVIVTPKVNCFPCSHTSACQQKEFICQQKIVGECLALLANELINPTHSLGKIAKEYSDVMSIYEVHNARVGFWYLMPVADAETEECLEAFINKYALLFYLSDRHKQTIPEYGSWAKYMAEDLTRAIKSKSHINLHSFLKLQSIECSKKEHILEKIKNKLLQVVIEEIKGSINGQSSFT